MKKNQNDLDDDLLQIPAFLRRQAKLAMSSDLKHLPVLVDEVISYLNPQKIKKFILMVLLDKEDIQKVY